MLEFLEDSKFALKEDLPTLLRRDVAEMIDDTARKRGLTQKEALEQLMKEKAEALEEGGKRAQKASNEKRNAHDSKGIQRKEEEICSQMTPASKRLQYHWFQIIYGIQSPEWCALRNRYEHGLVSVVGHIARAPRGCPPRPPSLSGRFSRSHFTTAGSGVLFCLLPPLLLVSRPTTSMRVRPFAREALFCAGENLLMRARGRKGAEK